MKKIVNIPHSHKYKKYNSNVLIPNRREQRRGEKKNTEYGSTAYNNIILKIVKYEKLGSTHSTHNTVDSTHAESTHGKHANSVVEYSKYVHKHNMYTGNRVENSTVQYTHGSVQNVIIQKGTLVEGSRELEERCIVCLPNFKLNLPVVCLISNTYKLANVTLVNTKSKTECKLKGGRETFIRKEDDMQIKVKIGKFSGEKYQWGKECLLKTIHRGYNFVYCVHNVEWQKSYTVKQEDGKFGKNLSVPWEKRCLVKITYICSDQYSVCNVEWRNYYTVKKADGKNLKKLTSHLGIITGFCIATLFAYIVKNSVNSESISCKMSKPESTPTPMDLDPFPPLGTKVEKPRGMRSVSYVILCIKWSKYALARYTWFWNVRGRKGYRHYGE